MSTDSPCLQVRIRTLSVPVRPSHLSLTCYDKILHESLSRRLASYDKVSTRLCLEHLRPLHRSTMRFGSDLLVAQYMYALLTDGEARSLAASRARVVNDTPRLAIFDALIRGMIRVQ